ncbi:MAG: ribosome silencing factor [Eubacterium sp.]|nr:ribosome silencing factor [Candidatus Colimonas fimequi]
MESKEMALKIAQQLDSKKAMDVTVIDIQYKSSFADYFVLATGSSNRQLGSLVDYVEDVMEPAGEFPKGVEGQESTGWVLMDYGDVIVNIMSAEMRDKYNIEKVWGDCDTLDIN